MISQTFTGTVLLTGAILLLALSSPAQAQEEPQQEPSAAPRLEVLPDKAYTAYHLGNSENDTDTSNFGSLLMLDINNGSTVTF